MGKITAPVLLTEKHDTAGFTCGIESLDEWLTKRAMKNQAQGASRTFVIEDEGKVVGYYALSSGSVERLVAPKSIARSMPEPIPVIVLGRLAIDKHYQGKRLGAALLKDAMLRTLSVTQNIGVRALLVHAISEKAKHFYCQYGFQVSPINDMTLLMSTKNIKNAL